MRPSGRRRDVSPSASATTARRPRAPACRRRARVSGWSVSWSRGSPRRPSVVAGSTCGRWPTPCGWPSRRGDRTRTCNRRFWRPVLYQLSHAPSEPAPDLAPGTRDACWRRGTLDPGRPVYGAGAANVQPAATGRAPVSGTARPSSRDRGNRRDRVWEHGRMGARVSDRIAAIAESATLAVDAKAKALKAAGRPVIGFGAGEPDFPTPDYIVEAAVAAARDPQEPPLHAGRRAARAARGDRRQDRARLRLRRSTRPRCWSPTAASRPSTTPSPRCSTRATRCCSSRRTGPPTPRRSSWPAACRWRWSPTRRPATWRTVEQLEAARTPRTKVLLFVLAVQPDRRGVPARAGRGDRRAGPPSTASGSSPTRSTSTWSTATRARLDAIVVPELADRVVVLNGVAKTYAMTGWRVGWMIGPADVDQGGHQPAVARDLATSPTSRRWRRWPRCTGDLSAVPQMRAAFDRRRRTIVWMLREIPGIVCPEPQGAFYVYPSVKGLLGRPLRGPDGGHLGGAGRDDPGGGRGRGRPGRGVRHAGLPAAVLRARRRRPGRGRQPDRKDCWPRKPTDRPRCGPCSGPTELAAAGGRGSFV